MLRVVTDVIIGERAAGESGQRGGERQREKLVAQRAHARSFGGGFVFAHGTNAEAEARRHQPSNHSYAHHRHDESQIITWQNIVRTKLRRGDRWLTDSVVAISEPSA